MEKEKFDLENFPTSSSAKKMLSYVTDGFYDKSYVGKWLYQVMGVEYDEAQKLAEALPEQFFPETATWGLMWHERKWNLPVRENLSYQERRRLIYQKRDYRTPMTPYRMETYLEDATGFKVRISDVNDSGEYGFIAPHSNVFKVFFVGEKTLDSTLVHEILDQLKQSHTTYTVNDRMEIVIDNRKLEQFRFHNVNFAMAISFWECCIFDGTLLFDGSRMFDAHRKNMKARLQFHTKLDVDIEKIEEMTIITKSVDYRLFDGSIKFDGSKSFNSIYRKETVE